MLILYTLAFMLQLREAVVITIITFEYTLASIFHFHPFAALHSELPVKIVYISEASMTCQPGLSKQVQLCSPDLGTAECEQCLPSLFILTNSARDIRQRQTKEAIWQHDRQIINRS